MSEGNRGRGPVSTEDLQRQIRHARAELGDAVAGLAARAQVGPRLRSGTSTGMGRVRQNLPGPLRPRFGRGPAWRRAWDSTWGPTWATRRNWGPNRRRGSGPPWRRGRGVAAGRRHGWGLNGSRRQASRRNRLRLLGSAAAATGAMSMLLGLLWFWRRRPAAAGER